MGMEGEEEGMVRLSEQSGLQLLAYPFLPSSMSLLRRPLAPPTHIYHFPSSLPGLEPPCSWWGLERRLVRAGAQIPRTGKFSP